MMNLKALGLIVIITCINTSDALAQFDTLRVVFRRSNCKAGCVANTVTEWGIGKYRSGYYYQTRKKTKQKFELPIDDKLDSLKYVVLYCGDTSTRIEEGYSWFEYREGLHKYYHPNGSLESIGVYNGNEKAGRWLYYDQSGVLVKEEYFEQFDGVIGTSDKFPKL